MCCRADTNINSLRLGNCEVRRMKFGIWSAGVENGVSEKWCMKVELWLNTAYEVWYMKCEEWNEWKVKYEG